MALPWERLKHGPFRNSSLYGTSLFKFCTAAFRHVLDTALDEFAGSDNRMLDIRIALGCHLANVHTSSLVICSHPLLRAACGG